MSDPAPKRPLEYFNYRGRWRPNGPPNPIIATLLWMPGLASWFVFAGVLMHLHVLPGPALMLWLIAIISAFTSLILYAPREKPWYVKVNLAFNIAGLLFTFVMPCVFMVFIRR